MQKKIDLSGVWNFMLDPDKNGCVLPYRDTMPLPGTTACFKKGIENDAAETGHLTELYPFKGYAWFSRTLTITEDLSGKNCFLFLERTRVTTVCLDDKKIGMQSSLCTPHVYDVTGLLSPGTHTITICVDNSSYPTGGGHMTSPDTQTNWNGITGRIELQIFPRVFADKIRLIPDAAKHSVTVYAELHGAERGRLLLSAESFNGKSPVHHVPSASFPIRAGQNVITYNLGSGAYIWSEYEPNLYRLHLALDADGQCDTEDAVFGLRDFKTRGDRFIINGRTTFLRGKHESLLFPLTGYAPTDVDAWLEKFRISQEYGINQYRFHTCCPPEAAFTAADMLGVYLEPELPFWGTVPEKDDPHANPEEWNYLTEEGFRMLRSFGNHPSFVMLSLGNELWGSKTHLDEILAAYKSFDGSRLYTQGSNNFQFCPEILAHEDFFCGVRFSHDRLIRGSYAMCDAPLGHVQTGVHGTLTDYDEHIRPSGGTPETVGQSGGKITIQFGTGVKTVDADTAGEGPVPSVPVVSHEIGQYAVYPDYSEIEKYTGPLRARNFEVFRRRLEDKGLAPLADSYFKCSGKLAAGCYREELEAAFRSKNLAGFQLLDLQDYSGQGTALVGMLNAFMESKGLISPEEWRTFCSDAVLLARFDSYVYVPGDTFYARIQLRYDRQEDLPEQTAVRWELKDGASVLFSGTTRIQKHEDDFFEADAVRCTMPETGVMKKLVFSLAMQAENIKKEYDIWLCPADIPAGTEGLHIFNAPSEELDALMRAGQKAVLFLSPESMKQSLEGTYCTDFWCYPMFRSISEHMGKPVPVGTMGLLIRNTHPALRNFPSEEYATEQWRNIVSSSQALVLDDAPEELLPIVQVIDNFERNHKLGILFECSVHTGSLLVCTCSFNTLRNLPEGKVFLSSILEYVRSEDFKPQIPYRLADKTIE